MNKKAKQVALIGILSGLAFITMLIEIPFPLATWLKFDLSETIVVYGMLVGGPLAGVAIAAGKSILHFIISGSNSGGVGQVAAFIAAISFALPCYYLYRATKKIIPSLLLGAFFLTLVMVVLNYYFITPFYANLFKMDFILDMKARGDGTYFKYIIYIYGLFNAMKGLVLVAVYAVIDRYLKKTYTV